MSAEHDAMLTETIARHFERAQVSGDDIDLGVAGLHMRCHVDSVRELGPNSSASLFFQLWGGQLGEEPIFASASGYGASVEEAIVAGGCNWACTVGPVLRVALGGESSDEPDNFEVTVHGQQFRVVVDGLDRVLFFEGGGGDDPLERSRSARALFGATPWLVTRVIESGTLPLLPGDRATILSVFACDQKAGRVLEVKVNGQDWPPSQHLLDEVPPSIEPGTALLRELALLMPAGPASPLTRAALAQTLAGATDESESGVRAMVGWSGWAAHQGQLETPLPEVGLRRLEADIGPLPASYRAFLSEVAEAGAGPGYGLLSPVGPAQARLAGGEFSWRDGDKPEAGPRGVVALAHAGCGVMWLLVIRGAHAGEVWVDAQGSDGVARRVAGSFEEWYRDWLDCLVRGVSAFAQWDPRCCATPNVLSRVLESFGSEGMSQESLNELSKRLGKGALSLVSGGGAYFQQGAALDPCQLCTRLVSRFGLGPDLFSPGSAPLQVDAGKKPGLLGRLTTGLRRKKT